MRSPEEILDLAIEAGGDESEATLLLSDRTVGRFAHSSLRQTTSLSSGRLTIRAISSGRAGVASTTSLRDEDVVATATLARTLAAFGNPTPPPRNRIREPIAAVHGTAADGDIASTLAHAFGAATEQSAELYGTLATTSSTLLAASSAGMRRSTAFTRADAQIIAVRGENSGYATRAGTDLDMLEVPTLASDALARATLLAGDEAPLPDGAYDVVLEPPAVAEILEWMSMIAFTGRSIEDESSLLAGRIGTPVWGERISIVNDPVDGDFLPMPFDAEGTTAARIPLVERGIARTAMFDRAAAERNGHEPNGGCPDLSSEDHGIPLHLHIPGGDASLESLLHSSRPLIRVTRFNYVNGLLDTRVALMTGLTRDGTFLYENGKPVRRLANARWTQSIMDAFGQVDSLSRETQIIAGWWNPYGGYRVPAIRIAGWHFRSGGR